MNLQNLIRSAGLIDDALVRPFNRFSQKVVNRRGKTFLPNFSGRNAVQNQVGSFTPRIPLPRNANSPVYTQGGAQRFAAEYGTGAPNVPAAAASVSKPGWQGNVLGAATTAVGLLGDPFGLSEALLGTVGKPNQSRMSLLGGVNTEPLVPKVSSATGANTRRPEGYSSYGTYTVGGIEYDINSGRPTYMPPGSVYSSSSVAPLCPAAERAYQSDKAAVAQQVAQDPALSQYDRDRAAAVASGDQAKMDAVRDQGMAIWAKANPTLAAKVKPGQSGYDVIQGALAGQAATQGYGYQMPQQIIPTPPPGINTPQGLPAVQSFTPSATYGAQGLEVDPELREKFQALLNQVKS